MRNLVRLRISGGVFFYEKPREIGVFRDSSLLIRHSPYDFFQFTLRKWEAQDMQGS